MSGNLTVNTSHGDVIAILKQSIAERKPLALCRFGDGEFCFINHRSTPSILKQFCKNWGFQYPKEISVARNMFLPILVRGLCGADLIGILDPKCRVLKGHSYKPEVWSSSLRNIQALGIASPQDLKVFDHQLTRSKAMGSPQGMAALLNHEPVHILSCRTKALQRNRLDLHLATKVTYTQVDSKLSLSQANREWLFKKIDEIKEFIVLVSLGPLGKDLPVLLKAKGKIGIDLGATVDAWASVASRPWFRSIQKHCWIPPRKETSEKVGEELP